MDKRSHLRYSIGFYGFLKRVSYGFLKLFPFRESLYVCFQDPQENHSEDNLLDQINQHAFGYQSLDRTKSLPRDLNQKTNEKLNGVSAHQGPDINQK